MLASLAKSRAGRSVERPRTASGASSFSWTSDSGVSDARGAEASRKTSRARRQGMFPPEDEFDGQRAGHHRQPERDQVGALGVEGEGVEAAEHRPRGDGDAEL